MSRRSRFGALHLVHRQLAADPVTSVLVALTVLLVATVLAAAPRAVGGLFGEDLVARVDELTPEQRDPVGYGTWGHPFTQRGDVNDISDVDTALDDLRAALADVREEYAGPALRDVLGEAEFVLTRPRAGIDRGDHAADITAMNVSVRVDPDIRDRVTMATGDVPGPVAPELLAALAFVDQFADIEDPPPMPVMASVDTADWLRWDVGEVRTVVDLPPMVLTGAFEPTDPDDDYWSHLESTVLPVVVHDGNVGTVVSGVLYADPSALPIVRLPNGMRLTVWYPVDVDGLAAADHTALAAQLRGFLAGSETDSELPETMDRVLERQAAASGLLSALTVGPAGAALGILWLAALLGIERRRASLVVARARGATAAQVRLALAVQGWVVGLPAAALGGLLATVAVRGPVRWGDYVLPAAVGLAPGILMALGGGRVGFSTARADLGSRRRTATRWALDGVVVGLAVVSVLLVRQRSATVTVGTVGADPLLIACPVLVALAAAVVVARLYPPPIRRVTAWLHRRRGLAHFLGAATAGRSPAAATGAMVALVVGVAGAVLCVVGLSTVRVAVADNAVRAAGADLRVDRDELTEAEVAAVRAIPGVAAVAEVGSVGDVRLSAGNRTVRLVSVTVDGAALAAVQAGLGLPPVPGVHPDDGASDNAETPDAAALPVLVATAPQLDGDVSLLASRADEPVLSRIEVLPAGIPGVTTGTRWLLLDAADVGRVTDEPPRVDRLLLSVDGPTAGVVAAVADAVDGARVTTPASARAGLNSIILVRSAQTALLVLAGLSIALCAAIVVLLLAVGAPARGRAAALLATLGAPQGVHRRLVLWDVLPVTVAGAVAGLASGAVLPALILAPADLRPFTGGAAQPAIAVEAQPTALLVAAWLVATGLAVALAVAAAGRTRAVTVLREGPGT